MTFSPKLIFWLTLYSTIGSGIAGGTIHLSGLIPMAWIPPVTGWVSFVTFCVLSFLTLATGYAGTGKGPLAGPPTREEARDIMTQAGVVSKAQPLTPAAGTQGKP